MIWVSSAQSRGSLKMKMPSTLMGFLASFGAYSRGESSLLGRGRA